MNPEKKYDYEEIISEARKLANGRGLRAVAREIGIPRTTLKDILDRVTPGWYVGLVIPEKKGDKG